MNRCRLVLLLTLAVVLVLIGLQIALAQGPVSLTLYADENSLTLYVPDTGGTVSLQGLAFEVDIGGARYTYRLEDYQNFRVLGLGNLETPLCFQLIRQGTAPILPTNCLRISQENVFTQDLFSGESDIFWFETSTSSTRTLFLLRGTERLSEQCPSRQQSAECALTYLPPTPSPETDTPTATLTPTPTLPPPRVLFILDDSVMMATLFAPGQTRWQAALEQVQRQLLRYPNKEVGIMVYGAPESFNSPDPVGDPEDACDDFEWRANYQRPSGINLEAVGLRPDDAPSGVTSLERAVFEGIHWEDTSTLVAIVLFFGGLTPDTTVNCGLTPGLFQTIVDDLSDLVPDGMRVYLIGIAQETVELESTENIDVILVESPEELVAAAETVGEAIEQQVIEERPDLATLPPLPANSDIASIPSPTPPPHPVVQATIRIGAGDCRLTCPVRKCWVRRQGNAPCPLHEILDRRTYGR